MHRMPLLKTGDEMTRFARGFVLQIQSEQSATQKREEKSNGSTNG